MKVNSLIGFLCLCCVLFASCDDDLRSVGGNIQPGGDDVSLDVDSLELDARTVLMNDSVYARSAVGLLGNYQDDTYGSISSEYLCEFYSSDLTAFVDGFYDVDSTKMRLGFRSYSGDSIAPMGVSFYELNNRLEKDYYTNLDVSKYCNLSKPLASASYSVKALPLQNTARDRYIEADMGDWGKKLHEATLTASNPLENSKAFLNYFPGVYVHTSFGSGSLVEATSTSIVVYYRTAKDTVVVDKQTKLEKDSVMFTNRTLILNSSEEVIQLSKVENKFPTNLLDKTSGAVYIKSPAGACVELELPIKDIIDKMSEEKNQNKKVSMAQLKLKCFTELEQLNPYPLGRVATLMLINKDSVQGFFKNPYRTADLSSGLIYTASRSASTNSFVFSNLAPMINVYREQFKDKPMAANPKFVLVPIVVESKQNAEGSSTAILGYFNSMKPAVSVIRAKKGDIKLDMIYSSF